MTPSMSSILSAPNGVYFIGIFSFGHTWKRVLRFCRFRKGLFQAMTTALFWGCRLKTGLAYSEISDARQLTSQCEWAVAPWLRGECYYLLKLLARTGPARACLMEVGAQSCWMGTGKRSLWDKSQFLKVSLFPKTRGL